MKGLSFRYMVLNGVYSYRTAENPAHIGFDGYANDLDVFLCFNEGHDVTKMACGKIADIVTFLADICSAGVSIGHDEHDPAFGAALLEPLVTPHGGFAIVSEIMHASVHDGAQSVHRR